MKILRFCINTNIFAKYRCREWDIDYWQILFVISILKRDLKRFIKIKMEKIRLEREKKWDNEKNIVQEIREKK